MVPSHGWRLVISDWVARCDEDADPLESTSPVPLFHARYGEVHLVDRHGTRTPFPEPEPNTIFIVPALVHAVMAERKDVFRPYGPVFDSKDRMIGYAGLAR